MKKILITNVLILLTLFSLNTYPIDKLVVFGDSLSDNGNLYRATLHTIPNAPYWQGHFSNGPTWDEDLTHTLGISLENYAVGGATSKFYFDFKHLPYNAAEEITNYEFTHLSKQDNDQTLFVIWIGGNDYLIPLNESINKNVNDTISGIKNDINRLASFGAKKILIMDLPDIGITPLARDQNRVTQLKELSQLHNQNIAKLVNQQRQKYPQIQIKLYKVSTIFNDLITHPSDYGITNTQTPCYSGSSISSLQQSQTPKQTHFANIPALATVLQIQNQYNQQKAPKNKPALECNGDLFFDSIHPTKQVHATLAAKVESFIKQNFN